MEIRIGELPVYHHRTQWLAHQRMVLSLIRVSSVYLISFNHCECDATLCTACYSLFFWLMIRVFRILSPVFDLWSLTIDYRMIISRDNNLSNCVYVLTYLHIWPLLVGIQDLEISLVKIIISYNNIYMADWRACLFLAGDGSSAFVA
jgi:hypothetical protein